MHGILAGSLEAKLLRAPAIAPTPAFLNFYVHVSRFFAGQKTHEFSHAFFGHFGRFGLPRGTPKSTKNDKNGSPKALFLRAFFFVRFFAGFS